MFINSFNSFSILKIFWFISASNKTKSNFRVELAIGSQKYGYFRNPEKILDKKKYSF